MYSSQLQIVSTYCTNFILQDTVALHHSFYVNWDFKQLRLAQDLKNSTYINYRMPRRAKLRDGSFKKIGRKSMKNRLLHMSRLDFDWIGPNISKNYI